VINTNQQKRKEFPETNPFDYQRYLVISLGTGLQGKIFTFDARLVANGAFFMTWNTAIPLDDGIIASHQTHTEFG
jgi:hypothetical protein